MVAPGSYVVAHNICQVGSWSKTATPPLKNNQSVRVEQKKMRNGIVDSKVSDGGIATKSSAFFSTVDNLVSSQSNKVHAVSTSITTSSGHSTKRNRKSTPSKNGHSFTPSKYGGSFIPSKHGSSLRPSKYGRSITTSSQSSSIALSKPSSSPSQSNNNATSTAAQSLQQATAPRSMKGESTVSLMKARGTALKHPAGNILKQYEQGCPVDCGKPWTRQHIEAALKRGPHISAKQVKAREALRNETMDKVKEGYAKVVKWKDIKHSLPTNFKLSPLAAIPHKSRAFRFILDLSFQLKVDGVSLPSVNSTTNKLAIQESMGQLGKVLPRMIYQLANAPEEDGPLLYAKFDIKDGYWRMKVSAENAWHFCYIMLPLDPAADNDIDELEIVVPSSLQMGWSESPPYFCTATETARDIAEVNASRAIGSLKQHPLEAHTLPSHFELDTVATAAGYKRPQPNEIAAHHTALHKRPKHNIEVYVDDFILAVQTLDPEALRHYSRAMLHAIHEIFPPPSVSGHQGEDPVSVKKLLQKEGLWEHRKEVLGWIFDGITKCIELPETKATKILQQLKTTLRKKAVKLNDFQKLVGKLRHASLGIPAGKGLFTPINHALKGDPAFVKLPNNSDLKLALHDWLYLIKDVASRPTSTKELVVGEPDYLGYCDASGIGAGGVWFGVHAELDPIVWRVEFPHDIRDRLVSESNPTGDITNSDLELAGLVLHWLVLEYVVDDLRHKHVAMYCDNTPTVAWANRLASKNSKIAGRLLRALALRQRTRRASPLLSISIAGEDNVMADVASRSFRGNNAKTTFEVSNNDFLTYFNSQFPLPQNLQWKQFHLASKVTTRVISEMQNKPLNMESWLRLPTKGGSIGTTGLNMSNHLKASIRTCSHNSHQHKSKLSKVLLHGSGVENMGMDRWSKLTHLVSRYEPLPRKSNWLDK